MFKFKCPLLFLSALCYLFKCFIKSKFIFKFIHNIHSKNSKKFEKIRKIRKIRKFHIACGPRVEVSPSLLHRTAALLPSLLSIIHLPHIAFKMMTMMMKRSASFLLRHPLVRGYSTGRAGTKNLLLLHSLPCTHFILFLFLCILLLSHGFRLPHPHNGDD